MIVLDTHAWLWWANEDARLSATVRGALLVESEIGICAISGFEVAQLVAKGRLRLERDPKTWVDRALAHERVRTLPVEPAIAVDAGLLDHDRFPGDPADRIIYATALHQGARLATKDRRLREFDPVLTFW